MDFNSVNRGTLKIWLVAKIDLEGLARSHSHALVIRGSIIVVVVNSW